MGRQMKKQQGITLIALVVTVVVLIILAAISITALNGDNGTVENSKEARDKTEISNEAEIVKISAAQASSKSMSGMVERDNLEKALDENIGERKIYFNRGRYKIYYRI